MHSLVERWGLPAIIMSLGDISKVLSEDAEDAELTPNQRGLILGACAQVSSLSDLMHAEMEYLSTNTWGFMDNQELENWKRIKEALEKADKQDSFFYKRAVDILDGKPDPLK